MSLKGLWKYCCTIIDEKSLDRVNDFFPLLVLAYVQHLQLMEVEDGDGKKVRLKTMNQGKLKSR
jgi:hypothetical protein